MLQARSFDPVVFPLLRSRKFTVIFFCAAAIQLTLVNFKVFGWTCPFLHLVGVPCPGCGLTRATSLLLLGDFKASLTYHAFAPVSLLGLLLVGSASLLPDQARLPMISRLELLERRSGLTIILLFALVFYWLARLLFLQAAFVQLIRG
jgi:hypothetical protein